jgi:hypothetical protein
MARIKYPAVFVAGAFLCWGIMHYVQTTERNKADRRFEEIYKVLTKVGQHQYCLGDTQVRNMHYAKPHDEPHWLCSECGDLANSSKVGEVVAVPKDRLSELRGSHPNDSDQSPAISPVETLTISEELDAILFLLKTQQAHAHTRMYTEEMINHYLKKHDHDKPGEHGKCPDCIKLRKRQITGVEFISRKEYNALLKLEKEGQIE